MKLVDIGLKEFDFHGNIIKPLYTKGLMLEDNEYVFYSGTVNTINPTILSDFQEFYKENMFTLDITGEDLQKIKSGEELFLYAIPYTYSYNPDIYEIFIVRCGYSNTSGYYIRYTVYRPSLDLELTSNSKYSRENSSIDNSNLNIWGLFVFTSNLLTSSYTINSSVYGYGDINQSWIVNSVVKIMISNTSYDKNMLEWGQYQRLQPVQMDAILIYDPPTPPTPPTPTGDYPNLKIAILNNSWDY